MGRNQILAIYTGFPNSRITITLSGLFFKNGRGKYSIASTSHGALHIEGHNINVVLEDCKFENNSYKGTTENGEGLYIQTSKSSITVRRCIFTNNSASWCGGAAYIWGDNVILKNNVFQNNSAIYGGALEAYGHQVYLEHNLFENNTAEFGGGAYITSEEAFLIGNSFLHNRQIVSGGYGYGGGCYLWRSYNATLVNNVFHDNTSGFGGGVYLSAQELTNVTLTITNNTFVYNSSTSHGGGLFVSLFRAKHTLAQIYNNLIWGNQSLSGSDLFINARCCGLTTAPEIKVYNNLYNDFAADTDSYVSIFQVNNIVSDPILVESFHLSSTSPCIDAGTADAPGLPETDFEGDPRIVGVAPDIGADEYTEQPIPNQPPVVTWIFQSQSDGTQIPEEGVIPEGTVVFKATLEDPDGDDVRLEIELREINEPFTGEPTSETISDFVPTGSEVTITRFGLVDEDYHWQYRVKDSRGAVSQWKEFGETGNVDFKIRSLLSKYAPVLYLYFDDFRPRSIESMLDNGGLWKWNNLANVLMGNCAECVIQGPVQVNQLLKHNRGNYFLDLWWAQNEDVCGGTTTPNVGSFWEKYKKVVYGRYYEPPGYYSTIVLQYWFFYVYNNWRDYGGLNNHEGDWEMVQVILDKKTKKPTYVTYSHHVLNDHTTVEWKNVSKIGTHPEVFVARGSHASYPSPGVHCVLGETKIGNKVISLCDILKDKYRRKLQDQTTGVETVLYPERDYKIICLNNYSWPTWEGRWGKRVKELKNGNCLRSGKCGPLSPGKQERKWDHPLGWALFSVPRVVAVVASPVHLHVYDQRGNHVGLTPEDLIEADIPGTLAHYSLGDEGELVAISTAEPLIYKIKGYEKGTFDFLLYKFLEENKVVMVSYKEVPVDENTTAILDSTSDNPNFLVDIDVNNDGQADYQLRPDSVTGVTGDLDHDGDIDRNDLNIILSYRNQEAGQCPECDLDNDGVITVLDARKLVLMCTRPRCEVEVIE